jgi:hypothetical protein
LRHQLKPYSKRKFVPGLIRWPQFGGAERSTGSGHPGRPALSCLLFLFRDDAALSQVWCEYSPRQTLWAKARCRRACNPGVGITDCSSPDPSGPAYRSPSRTPVQSKTPITHFRRLPQVRLPTRRRENNCHLRYCSCCEQTGGAALCLAGRASIPQPLPSFGG